MFRIAVIGCGRIGKMHADIVASLEGCRLSVVYDPVEAASLEVSQKHQCHMAKNVEEAMDNADGVLIATSTATHADLIELGVKKGKAVFCEKPIDLSIDRVRQLHQAIGEEAARKVQIGFQRRFDVGCQALIKARDAGEIGDVHQIIITSRDPAPAPYSYLKVSGGIFRDMSIHDLDIARHLLGEDPVEVFAVGNVLVDEKIGSECNDHDTVMIILRTASGKQCYINNSRSASYGYDQRMEIFGSKGMVITDNRLEHNVRRYSSNATDSAPRLLDFFIERYFDAYRASLQSFVAAVTNNQLPQVNFHDGKKALLLAEAANKSLAEGRMVAVSYD